MSDSHLTELPWKALVVKQQLKDPGLGAALAAYGKTDAEDPEARSKALAVVEKKAEAARKDAKDNKDVVRYLDEVLEAVGKARKAIAMQDGADDEDDDEAEADEYRKDLRKKLIAALGQVKSRAPGEPVPGEDGKPQLRFMAYTAGGSSAVIVARKVGPATKKLLPEIAGGAKGGKFITGQCIYEKSCFTFVVEEASGGLAKKLAKALLAETGNKYKVRLRTLDGARELDSDTDKDPDEVAAPASPPRGATVSPPPTETLLQAYRRRLQELVPGLQQALKEQRGDTGKMRAVVEFAREKADAGALEAALKALDALEKLLAAAGVSAGREAEPEPVEVDPAARFNARLAALLPAVKEAMAEGGDLGQEIKLKVSEAGVLARKKDYEQAGALLDEVDDLLADSSDDEDEGTEGDEQADDPEDRELDVDEAKAELEALGLGIPDIWLSAVDAFAAATDTVNAQITQLQLALRETGDVDLLGIADSGLNALTAGTRVPLMAALMDAGSDGANIEAAAPKVLKAVAAFRTRLNAPEIMACDSNPFGVEVSIADTFAAALDQLGYVAQLASE